MANGRVYFYVVDRDFGFAPNPFHGCCSLATCKPGIRNSAQVGDWVIGMGGGRLNGTGRCVFAMRVTEKMTFNEYSTNQDYFDKKPVRNGSRRMMVGDNIYHFDERDSRWNQSDSHHSNADGSINHHNLETDTKANKVLVSRHFFYFGSGAPTVPSHLLTTIGYQNGRNYRVFSASECADLIDWIHAEFKHALNSVFADPFDFANSDKRYSAGTNKVY